jgi:hypothetical protein
VQLITEPPEAKISIHERPDLDLSMLARQVQLAEGEYTVTVSHEGYQTKEGELVVRAHNELQTYTFTLDPVAIPAPPDRIAVQITSDPPGALVEIEGDATKAWSTPARLDLSIGEYTIRISKPGFDPHESKIAVAEQDSNQFHFALVEKTYQLRITVDPPESAVAMNGASLEIDPRTGQAGTKIGWGKPARLSVEATGYESATRELSFEELEAADFQVSISLRRFLRFQPRPEEIVIDVEAVTPDAEGRVPLASSATSSIAVFAKRIGYEIFDQALSREQLVAQKYLIALTPLVPLPRPPQIDDGWRPAGTYLTTLYPIEGSPAICGTVVDGPWSAAPAGYHWANYPGAIVVPWADPAPLTVEPGYITEVPLLIDW